MIIYIGEFVILSLNYFKSSIYLLVQGHFLNVLYILCISFFILYGFGLYRTWKNRPIARKNKLNLKRMRLTLAITIVVCISFSIRIVVNAIRSYYIENWSFRYPFEVIFYTFVEVFPIIILLSIQLASGFRFEKKKSSFYRPLITEIHEEISSKKYDDGFDDSNGSDDSDDSNDSSDSNDSNESTKFDYSNNNELENNIIDY